MSSFDPQSYTPGRAIVFGSVVFELTDAAEPVEELSWWHRIWEREDDLLKGFSLFSLLFAENPSDVYVVQAVPNVVSPFVVSLPPGLYKPNWLNVEIDYQLWRAPIEGLAFRAEADRATYVGRVVFQVPRVVKRNVPVRFELLNAEEHDRAALAKYLSSIQVPFDKRLMGEGAGTTTWTGSRSTAPAPATPIVVTVPNQRSGC
ncbi:MAG: hypothetical protein V3U03_02865 [Myxococcota bacterium]